jgi:hypothetical protein
MDEPPAPTLPAGGVVPLAGAVGLFDVPLTGVPLPWLGSLGLGVGAGVVDVGLVLAFAGGVVVVAPANPPKSGTPSALDSDPQARLANRANNDEQATR